jgi:hypothetical protein
MATLAWILFVVAVVWHIGSQRLNHRKRIALENYVIYLLLADELRTRHQADFRQWIARSDARDAMALSSAAHITVDGMAERLAAGDPQQPATSSTLGAHSMLWNAKQGGKSPGAA